MERLLKPRVQERADEIKKLLLRAAPFEEELNALYTDLRLAGRHKWTVRVYRLLCLYADKNQKEKLYHPALLQAFLSEGDLRGARCLADKLLQRNPSDPETRKLFKSLCARSESTLPPYTPVASLSKYAAERPARKKKSEVLPPSWRERLEELTADSLQKAGYFGAVGHLRRAPRACRAALTRTFDELASSYLWRNYRAVAVLSGSMLEMLLALYVRKKLNVRKISVGGRHPQNLFDLNLYDLLCVCEANALPEPKLLKLFHAARVQRNFIHPGKELLEKSGITPAGARVCYFAVLEAAERLF